MKSNFKKCASAVKYLPSRGIPNPELFSEFGGRIGGLLYGNTGRLACSWILYGVGLLIDSRNESK